MKILLSTLVVFLSLFAFSQQEVNTSLVTFPKDHVSGWNSYYSSPDFDIEYQFINCDPQVGFDHEAVVLRIVNKTSNTLDFDWVINIYRDGVCETCAYPVEYARTIQLAPNETIEGTCDRETNKQLKIFSKYIDQNYSKGLHLTGFQLGSFTVTTIQ